MSVVSAILGGTLAAPRDVEAAPSIQVEITPDQTGPVAADSVITFDITIIVGDTGVGNLTLEIAPAISNCFFSGVYVGPGTRLYCSAEYTVTDADAANGEFTTTVRVTGWTGSETIEGTGSVVVTAGEGLPTPTNTPTPSPTPTATATSTPAPPTLSIVARCFDLGSLDNNGDYMQELDVEIVRTGSLSGLTVTTGATASMPIIRSEIDQEDVTFPYFGFWRFFFDNPPPTGSVDFTVTVTATDAFNTVIATDSADVNCPSGVVPTNTPTNTPTETPTETPTNTPTNTPTETPTETPTNTPTNTPTETPTETPTNTPTNTPIPPTETPTNTPTNTVVPVTETPTSPSTATATTEPTATSTGIPLEDGAVAVTIVTEDGSEIPETTIVCLDLDCRNLDDVVAAAAPSGTTVTFEDIAPGDHLISVTVGGALAASQTVTVAAGTTTSVTILLPAADATPNIIVNPPGGGSGQPVDPDDGDNGDGSDDGGSGDDGSSGNGSGTGGGTGAAPVTSLPGTGAGDETPASALFVLLAGVLLIVAAGGLALRNRRA